MVCLNCGHETQVGNTRPQIRTNSIWRRRFCPLCSTVYTTHEQFDLENTWTLRRPNGKIVPFLRDKLYVSILQVCDGEDTPYGTATSLTATVISQLMRVTGTNEPLDSHTVAHTTATVLKRFKPLLAVRYMGMHPESFNTKKLTRGLL